jgi:hypothetical protein
MSRDDLPEHVRTLIESHIESVQQVEILVLLRAAAERGWAAGELCRSLHLSAAVCEGWIDRFAAAGIVTRTDERILYAAGTPHDPAVDDLLDLYSRRRHSVIESIYGKPRDAV